MFNKCLKNTFVYIVFAAMNWTVGYSHADTLLQKIAPSPGLPLGAYAGEISKEHLSIGQITIGEDSIGSLLFKFGESDVVKDDGGSPAFICYTSTKKGRPLTVVFEAWGRSKESEIIGFTLLPARRMSVKSGRVTGRCSITALLSHGLATKSGVRVGIGEGELKKIFGEPLHESQNVIDYVYSSKSPVPPGDQADLPKQTNEASPQQYDVLAAVEILKHKQRVTSIVIRQTKTF